MQVCQRRLMGIPVRTRSGVSVGRFSDFIFDTGTGRMTAIIVRTRAFLPIRDNELRIAWTQVISVTEKEIIVTDGSVPGGNVAHVAGKSSISPGSAPIA